VLTSTTPGGVDAYPIPAQTLRLLMAAPTMPWDKALRRFVENALAPATVAGRPELVARIYERRLTNPLDLAGWQAQAAAGTTFDAYARVSEIKAPTLVLHGTDDNVVDVRNADLLAELIPGARVELLPGAGHLFYWEQPDWFVDRVRGFLHG
jgi:pimeloyl-ACP methyl ester carboxylesterase